MMFLSLLLYLPAEQTNISVFIPSIGVVKSVASGFHCEIYVHRPYSSSPRFHYVAGSGVFNQSTASWFPVKFFQYLNPAAFFQV